MVTTYLVSFGHTFFLYKVVCGASLYWGVRASLTPSSARCVSQGIDLYLSVLPSYDWVSYVIKYIDFCYIFLQTFTHKSVKPLDMFLRIIVLWIV